MGMRRRFLVVSAGLCLGGFLGVASSGGAQPPVAKPQPPPAATPAAPATTTPAVKPAPVPGGATTPTQPPSAVAAAASGSPGQTGTAATTASPAAASASAVSEPTPDPLVLGIPVLPNAIYLGSYDAGGAGQRFYLFGSVQSFADVVGYYRTVLRDKGDLVFDVPPTHMFEVGKFKEEQVAFPPGVTVKDYRLAGGAGLPHPRAGATPAAFPTVIQIVPAPVLPAARPR